MDANSFGDPVRSKITERRQGRSEAMRAALERQRQANERAAPLLAALRNMLDRLSRDPMFSRAFPGPPEPKIADQFRDGLSVTVDAAVGMMLVSLHEDGGLKMSIHPHYRVKEALDCGHRYEPRAGAGDHAGSRRLSCGSGGPTRRVPSRHLPEPAASMIMPAAGEPDGDEGSGFR